MLPFPPHFPPDCLAQIRLLTTEEGGRQTPAASGYRPNHAVRDDYLTTGVHDYLDADKLEPGESALAHIVFASPEHYPRCLWSGKLVRIQEGGRLVGFAKIIDVYNPLLDRNKD